MKEFKTTVTIPITINIPETDGKVNNMDIIRYDIESIKFYGCAKIPVAVLTDYDGNDIGYLSPFRGLSFQVSKTIDGQWDKGSIKVIRLGNIWSTSFTESNKTQYNYSNCNERETKLEILKGLALIAIEQFTSIARRDKSMMLFVNHNKKFTGDNENSDGAKNWCQTSLDFYIHEVGIWLDNQLN